MSFKFPYEIMNHKDEPRRAGFELEFSGIKLETVGHLVEQIFGGQLRQQDTYVYEVINSSYGDFKLECDSTFLKERKYKKFLEMIGVNLDAGEQLSIDQTLADHSDVLIPYELVTPPLRYEDFHKLEELKLAMAKEMGSVKKSTFSIAPCGLHINPEVASLNAQYILNVLRSFCLLYDDIVQEQKIQFTRQVAPYIDAFPKAYVSLIMASEYAPSFEQFAKDYLRFNPTRNRALDLTPLISFVNHSLLEKCDGVELSLIKARPTFHYRLPNCKIADTTWSIAEEWNIWVDIETLAQSPHRLEHRMNLFNEGNKVKLAEL